MTRAPRDADWAAWFANPEPLDVELYGAAYHMATQPGVQSAATVSRMFELSRVPLAAWYAPLPEPKPTVPQEVADDIAVAVLGLRRTRSRAEVMQLLNLTSISAVCRLEQANVHVGEVDAVTKLLDAVAT